MTETQHQIQIKIYEAEAVLLHVQAELKEAQAKELIEYGIRGKPR